MSLKAQLMDDMKAAMKAKEDGKQKQGDVDRKKKTLFPALLTQFAFLSEIKRRKPSHERDIAGGGIIRI